VPFSAKIGFRRVIKCHRHPPDIGGWEQNKPSGYQCRKGEHREAYRRHRQQCPTSIPTQHPTNGRSGQRHGWRWSARRRGSCQPVCVSVAQTRRRVAARHSGADCDAWGPVWTTTALGQNREQEGKALLRKFPRKYGTNAKRRERWLSAWRVNPCGGAFALKVKGSPRRTGYELLFQSARLRADANNWYSITYVKLLRLCRWEIALNAGSPARSKMRASVNQWVILFTVRELDFIMPP
jgi:hypothetical protein